jgi:peptidoglycan/xylan/chitin deacetylase (PgdA/CDA1 family)
MPEPSIDTQIADAQDAIVRASGYTPHQFRSPGGRWSPALMHASAAHNLTAIDWNIDPPRLVAPRNRPHHPGAACRPSR